MSIKTKMQSLIDAANAETGKGDADLTAAVQSLISESGGITPSGNKAITATTSTQTDIDVTNYATVSVAPTPSETKSVTTNGDVTPSSGKLLSKVTVNVPTGEARTSSDLAVSGATVNVPAGLYSSAASKSVASGTAGTPTASKGAVSNNSVTVTPSVTNTTGYITGGTKTGTGVTVSASELVSGNKALTPSETAQSDIDVTNFKTASVGAISSTYVGSGVTKKAAATVEPSTSEQTVCASGVYTTGEQKVSAITPSIVGNLGASSFAASIVAAIEGKGVTVPDGTLLDGMAALIESIGAGGDAKIATGSFTPTADCNYYEITHNLGEKPTLAICLCTEIIRVTFEVLYDDSTQRIARFIDSKGYLSGLDMTNSSIINQTSPSGSAVSNSGMYNATENTIKAGNELLSSNYFVTGAQYIWIVAVI